jgi:DNA-binding transcriptional LysR family regulator
MIEPSSIDLNLLSVFQEVYRERQISAAARRLGLTQSAVSNALARLRRTFGDELFVRTAHGMQPTPLAQQMAEPIGAAMAQVGSPSASAAASTRPAAPAVSRWR